MKQKIVIRVHMKCNKCRIKAMKLVASVEGLDSLTLEGDNKDQLVLIGDGVDPARVTHALRKKVGHADIIKVEEVKKKETEKEKEKKPEPKIEWYPPCPPCPPVIYYTDDCYSYGSSNPNICSIM